MINNASHYFLQGGGEMGELIREKDWGQTSLGDPSGWPQSLQTMVAVMLDNPFGMYIAWGNDYIQLYNDGYRPILGATKHPHALGIGTRETFAEIWDIIETMFDGVMKGKAVGFPDFMLPLNRNGFIEECYFDFSYSPIRKDNGEVGGVLVTVIETTNKKKAEEALKESEQRFRDTVKQAPVGMAILRGNEYVVEMANDAYLLLVDRKASEFVGKPLFKSLPEVEEAVHALLDTVLSTGIPFHGNEVPIPVNRHGKQEVFYFDFLYYPLKENDGKISGIIVSVMEVTEKVTAGKKIKENGKLLESIFFNAPAAIAVITGPEHTYVLANNEYQNMVSRTSEQLVGKTSKSIFPELVGTGTFEIFDAVYQSGEPFSLAEYPVKLDKNNAGSADQIYFRFSAVPLKDPVGKFDSIVIVAVDITEQVLARKKIEEIKNRFQLLVQDAAAAIVVLTGPEMKVEIVNEAYGHLINFKPQELLGRPLFDLIPDAAEYYLPLLENVRQTGETLQLNDSPYAVTVNGKRMEGFLHVVYQPYRDLDGNILGVMTIMQDVTETALARKKIEQSEKKFEAAILAVEGIIWTNNGKGEMIGEQPGWAKLTGQSFEEYQGYGWAKAVHPDDAQATLEAWNNAVASRSTFEFEHRVNTKENGWKHFSIKAVPVFDAKGSIEEWVGVHTDITEHRTFANELERQVRIRTKELADSNIELEKMNKELQSFAYISSHDLQEPLRKVQIFSSQIIEKEAQNLSAAGRDKVLKMQSAAQRMQNLINDLFAYSRTSTEKRNFEMTDLMKIIEDVKEDLKEDLKDKQAIFEAHPLCEVRIIPFQFRQLMLNLIGNALKFSNPAQPPHIIIKSETASGIELNNAKLSPQNKYCHISVSDNGIGFEQEYSEKIFEVFQRLHGQNDYKGTGIGLSIVKKIVENHEGIITAHSELNKGSTFDIYIPAK